MISNLELKESDILKSLLILNLTSGKSTLKNLDLLIEESKLIISSNELSSKNISLVDDVLVVLLELFNFLMSLLDDVVQVLNLVELLNSKLFSFVVFLLPGDELRLDLLNLLSLRGFLMMLSLESHVLGINLILQLGDLMGCDLELSLELSHLVLSLDQVLRVEISVGSNSLIQVLLLLELTLELNILFLELTDKVLLQLDLLNHLHEIGIGFGSFVRELISILLENIDLFEKVSNVLLLGSSLLLELGNLIDFAADLVLVLHVLILCLLDRLGHHVSESDQIDDLLLVLLGVSAQVLDLSSKSVNTVLGQVLLVFSLLLFIGDSLLVGHQAVVHTVVDLVHLLQLSVLVTELTDLYLKVVDLHSQGLAVSQNVVVLVLEGLEVTALEDILLLLGIQLVLDLLVLIPQVLDGFLVLLLVLTILFDSALFLLDLLLHVLFLSIEELGISLELGLLLGKFLDLMLLLLDLLLLLHQVVLEFQDLLIEVRVGVLEILVLLLLHLNFLLEVLLGSHKLVDSVVLTKRETRSLLHNLVEFGDLVLKTLNNLPGLLLLVLGSLNKLPALLNFPSEDSDSVRIFLSELDCSLDSCSILQNCVI